MIADLGLEFLPFSYLLIYVGAIAVMFLFVIVAVDPIFETQKIKYEESIFMGLIFSNALTSIFYLFFSFLGGNFRETNFGTLLHDSDIKENQVFIYADYNDFSFVYDKRFNFQLYEKLGGGSENLSLYSILEYKLKDVTVFSNYFFNHHTLLLIIIGFILTSAMLVSFVIARNFAEY